jgi:hypothetical protein
MNSAHKQVSAEDSGGAELESSPGDGIVNKSIDPSLEQRIYHTYAWFNSRKLFFGDQRARPNRTAVRRHFPLFVDRMSLI